MSNAVRRPAYRIRPWISRQVVLLCSILSLSCAAKWAAAAPPGSPAGRVDCRAITSAILHRSVRYCVLLPDNYDAEKARKYPVLYYLHGLGDNEQWLLNSGAWDGIEDLRSAGKIGEFLIVSPDAGRSFYINSLDGRDRYEDFFIREFIPAVESRYRVTGARASRGIGGFSMGGYGALRFAFRYPQLFSSVSAHSAALIERLSANDSAEFVRTLSAFGNPINEKFWEKNTPFMLLREARPLNGLKISFDCGRQDDYGFEEGSESLHELLKSHGIPHDFHLYPGGHNWQYMAAHFDESMEFHSRAFAAAK